MSAPIKNKDGAVIAWVHGEPGECVEVKTDDVGSLQFHKVLLEGCEHDWVGVSQNEATCLKCHAHRCTEVAKRQVDFHTPNHFRYPSTTEELLDYGGAFFNQCLAIAEERNKRYAVSNKPFKNFELAGEFGIAVRMSDKVSRLLTLLHPSNTTDDAGESIEDTCKDLANYSMLLSALRTNERGGK